MDDLNLNFNPPRGLRRALQELYLERFVQKCKAHLNPEYHPEVERRVSEAYAQNPESPLTVQTNGYGSLVGVNRGWYEPEKKDPRKEAVSEIISDVIEFDMALPDKLTPTDLMSHLMLFSSCSTEDLIKARRRILGQVRKFSSYGVLSNPTMGLLLDIRDGKSPSVLPIDLDTEISGVEVDYRSHLLKPRTI